MCLMYGLLLCLWISHIHRLFHAACDNYVVIVYVISNKFLVLMQWSDTVSAIGP